jgi:hypothetical protein
VNAGWDREVLAIDLQALVDLNFGVEIASSSLAGVDLLLDERREASPEPSHDANEEVSPLSDFSFGHETARRPLASRPASPAVRQRA